ncbi:MAG: hypothetical protein PHQ23_17440, partial [Candidatus Wallbacteria bacterium]|nr:hypothetical protein [Candidatus Wallbacteria bacterium]
EHRTMLSYCRRWCFDASNLLDRTGQLIADTEQTALALRNSPAVIKETAALVNSVRTWSAGILELQPQIRTMLGSQKQSADDRSLLTGILKDALEQNVNPMFRVVERLPILSSENHTGAMAAKAARLLGDTALSLIEVCAYLSAGEQSDAFFLKRSNDCCSAFLESSTASLAHLEALLEGMGGYAAVPIEE